METAPEFTTFPPPPTGVVYITSSSKENAFCR